MKKSIYKKNLARLKAENYPLREIEQGSALVMALVVLTMGLTISFTLSVIFLNQIVLSRQIEFSIKAFAAADSGIEEALYQDRVNPNNLIGIGIIDFTGVKIDGSRLSDPAIVNKYFCVSSGNIVSDPNQCTGNGGSYQYNFFRDPSNNLTRISASGIFKGVKRTLQVFY